MQAQALVDAGRARFDHAMAHDGVESIGRCQASHQPLTFVGALGRQAIVQGDGAPFVLNQHARHTGKVSGEFGCQPPHLGRGPFDVLRRRLQSDLGTVQAGAA